MELKSTTYGFEEDTDSGYYHTRPWRELQIPSPSTEEIRALKSLLATNQRQYQQSSAPDTNDTARNAYRKPPSIARRATGVITFYSFPVVVLLAGALILVTWAAAVQSKLLESKAMAELKNGNPINAIALLDRSIKFDRSNRTAYKYCQELSEQNKNLEDAYNYVSNELEVHPNDKVLLEKKGDLSARLGWHSSTVETYNRLFAISNSPKLNQLENRGSALLALGEYDKATMDFACMLRLDPKYLRANEGIAQCYMALGKNNEALDKLNRVIRSSRQRVSAHLLRGQCFQAMKNYAEAEAEYAWVLAKEPNNVDGYQALASLMLSQGKQDGALDHLKTAVSIAPQSFEARQKLADLLVETGKYQQAINEFQTIDSLNSKKENFATLSSRCKAFVNVGDNQQAMSILNKLISLRPQEVTLYMERAQAQTRLQQFSRAMKDLDTALELQPGNCSALLLKAQCHLAMSDETSAVEDYKLAMRSNPNSTQPCLALARFEMDNAQYASALESFKAALKIDSNSVEGQEGAKRAQHALMNLVGNSRIAVETAQTKEQFTALNSLGFDQLVSIGYEALMQHRSTFACEALKRAVLRNPNSKEARRYLAFALIDADNPDAAQEQFIALGVLGAEQPEDYVRLANAFTKAGRPDKAFPILERHLKQHKTDVTAILALVEANIAYGERDEARTICEKAISTIANSHAQTKLREKLSAMKNDEAHERSSELGINAAPAESQGS